jgi:hypothetical protein
VFALFALVIVVAGLLILPGWLWARRRSSQSGWLLLLPLPGVAVWVALTAVGIGAQSLANVIEIFAVAGAAVIAAYLKFLVLDRRFQGPYVSGLAALVGVVVVTMALRLLMPSLPE